MKVICNGFNLYGQLNQTNPIVENFERCFDFEVIKRICINHSYSVIFTGEECVVFQNNERIRIKTQNHIVSISSNDDRIIILDDTGKLLRAELANFNLVHTVPTSLFSDCSEGKVISISSGSKLTVAYTTQGVLYNVPEKLSFWNANIVDIRCGREHCLLLDQSGDVYSFGGGSRGQLGHGKLVDETEPQLVEALAGIKISQIATGGWHSCAISKDGDLYAWGWNSNGQLGLGVGEDGEKSVSVMATPHIVDIVDSSTNVLKVACGSRHTIALLDNKHLYGCGWNKYKQLKNDQSEFFLSFTYLHNFTDDDVVDVTCGPWNSVVICK